MKLGHRQVLALIGVLTMLIAGPVLLYSFRAVVGIAAAFGSGAIALIVLAHVGLVARSRRSASSLAPANAPLAPQRRSLVGESPNGGWYSRRRVRSSRPCIRCRSADIVGAT